ncbi:Transposase DDE domain group 1 [Nitrosomonas aestuarii]|uniref:Transposase DDE domain group 1 n=1 Tax=Nitrosomonas aestuarii TaxID=52441 RepID=A0A1I4FX84_9PROT|nr:Transposase DDE domain group 1 [Nitrosomonas aestuarii]
MREAVPIKSFIIQLPRLHKREELPVTDCTQRSFDFPEVKKRVVEVNFEGGDITSDGGVMLLRQADRLIGLIDNEDSRCWLYPITQAKIMPI